MKHDIRFPRFVAETLAGTRLVLPDSLDGQIGLIVLAFRRHAQPAVDSWIGPVSRRYASTELFGWYEVPMLAGGWRMISGFIEGGMRSGVRPRNHDHVATCYGDAARIRAQLGIGDLDSAHGYVLDRDGRICWNGSGWGHQRRLDRLFDVVDALLDESRNRT
jgi:hypothetical protein